MSARRKTELKPKDEEVIVTKMPKIEAVEISDAILDESLVRLYNSFKAGEQYTPLELATQMDRNLSETRIEESLNRLKGKRLPLALGHIKS